MLRAVVRRTIGTLSTSLDETVVCTSAQMNSLAKTKAIHNISTVTPRFRTANLTETIAALPDEEPVRHWNCKKDVPETCLAWEKPRPAATYRRRAMA